jgi:hypothetical protein
LFSSGLYFSASAEVIQAVKGKVLVGLSSRFFDAIT